MRPNKEPNLVLAGFMGTGKSTVGALVAQRLGRAFLDTDTLVEAGAGKAVREIFTTHGEACFRRLERESCLWAARQSGVVVSTGGGALLDLESKHVLEQTGIVILLTCNLETLVRRLEDSVRRGERPLLGEGFVQKMEGLLRARESAYAAFVLRVDTTRLVPGEVADQILDIYHQTVQQRWVVCTT